jgi:hypothetical protein
VRHAERSSTSLTLGAKKPAKSPSPAPVSKPTKKRKPETAFKSKAFLDSDDNPVSGPVDEDLADEAAPPPKKKPKKEATATVKKTKVRALAYFAFV